MNIFKYLYSIPIFIEMPTFKLTDNLVLEILLIFTEVTIFQTAKKQNMFEQHFLSQIYSNSP